MYLCYPHVIIDNGRFACQLLGAIINCFLRFWMQFPSDAVIMTWQLMNRYTLTNPDIIPSLNTPYSQLNISDRLEDYMLCLHI